MRQYSVHVRAGRPAEDPDLILLREGFCWPAFLLPAVWAIWFRVWRGLAAYVAAGAALGFACSWWAVGEIGQALLGLGLSVICGAEANDWRRAALARQGYRELPGVAAPTLIEAEARVLNRQRFAHGAATLRPAAI